MAKKYGTGPTKDKKSSTYTAIAPDGSLLKKKSFFVHEDKALMAIFEHKGKLEAAGITTEEKRKLQNWSDAIIFLEATKIS